VVGLHGVDGPDGVRVKAVAQGGGATGSGGQAFQPAGSADFPVRRNAGLFRCRGVPARSWGLTVPGTGRLDSLPYKLSVRTRRSLGPARPVLSGVPDQAAAGPCRGLATAVPTDVGGCRRMSADVGQAFQPAGSADFPVRRDARLFRCRGVSAPSWGLTVPGTGRLDSLPYELSVRTRRSLGPARPARSGVPDQAAAGPCRSGADGCRRMSANVGGCRAGFPACRFGGLSSPPRCPAVPVPWCARTVLGTDSPRNWQARQPALRTQGQSALRVSATSDRTRTGAEFTRAAWNRSQS